MNIASTCFVSIRSLCCLTTPDLRKDIQRVSIRTFSVMNIPLLMCSKTDHILDAQVEWEVSLVIADGNFKYSPGFLWGMYGLT